MATTAGRRLSELLQEKQERFLIHHGCSRTTCQAAVCWIHGVGVKLRRLCIRCGGFMIRRTGVDERATLSTSKLIAPPRDRVGGARFSDRRRSHRGTRFGKRRLILHCLSWEIYRKHKGWSVKKNGEILRWKKQSNVWQLKEIDLSASGEEWCRLQPEIGDIGLEIESIIFEEMREETALVLLGYF